MLADYDVLFKPELDGVQKREADAGEFLGAAKTFLTGANMLGRGAQLAPTLVYLETQCQSARDVSGQGRQEAGNGCRISNRFSPHTSSEEVQVKHSRQPLLLEGRL